MTAETEADVAPSRRRPRWQVLLVRPEAATLALLVLAAVLATNLSPFFADIVFILESSTFYMEYAIVALVLTMVIISGEIDLSGAAMMALAACVFGATFEAGAPIALAIAAGLATGLVMGALNGFLVIGLGLPSIIVTIGTLTLFRGIAQVLAGDQSIGGFPGWFIGLDWRLVAGMVPVPVAIFAILALALALVMGFTVLGRQIYQIGTSPVAAAHAGIRVKRVKWGLFLAMGFTSAAAGIMATSRLASVRYDLATGAELQMVLMVMLGGTYIFGGRGSILGTFLAVWLLVIIATGMTVENIPINLQLIVMGLLLIVSIVAANALYARTQR